MDFSRFLPFFDKKAEHSCLEEYQTLLSLIFRDGAAAWLARSNLGELTRNVLFDVYG